jgi:LCP family protein required for cell wall assembly
MAINMNIDAKKTPEIINRANIKPVGIKKKFNKKIIWGILGILFLIGAAFAYRTFEFSNSIGIKIRPIDILNPIKKDPQLKKDSTGKYTSALLVGIDTRSAKSDLKNTDSMIIATYNYETGNITMISVPRDLYVKVPNEAWYTKINGIYTRGEAVKKGSGMEYLKGALQTVTGIEIQYHALIDLQGFVKMIDAVGGVTVNVENSFTDYMFPTEAKGKPVYETISFKKGPQKMDGTIALKYARSRHSSDAGEGTDFARARRQQKVISALKDKVLSTGTLLNPQKILELMQAVQDNVKLSEINNEEIQASINIAKKQQETPGKSYSFVLDPSFGGNQVITQNVPGVNAYVIAPVAGLDNYTQVKALVKLCLTKPGIYSQKAKIRVYDSGIGNVEATKKANDLKKKYPYLDIIYMGTLYKGRTGTVVYAHTSKFSESVTELSKYFETEMILKPEYVTTNLNNEDVTVLFGKAPVVTETK